jgi:hypothetical protein
MSILLPLFFETPPNLEDRFLYFYSQQQGSPVIYLHIIGYISDRLCGLVVRILGWVRFPALPEKKVVGLERGPLSLVSTTEELPDRKVADPV